MSALLSDRQSDQIKVLLVEDDEDDYVLARAWLAAAQGSHFKLTWASAYETALHCIKTNAFDVILMDYDLGAYTGFDLAQEMLRLGCQAPIIFLTGRGSYDIDLAAMQIGAMDYLTKSEVSAPLLERTIRYAVQRQKIEKDLRQARDDLELRVQERTQELTRANESLRYQAYLLENINDAVIAVDPNFIITAWNRAAEEIYGWTAAETIGCSADSILKVQWLDRSIDVLREALDKNGAIEAEALQVHKNGSTLQIEMKAQALKDDTGKITGYLSVNRDITLRRQVEAELAEVQRRLLDRDERERLAIAQELHDGPMQELYGVMYQLETLRGYLNTQGGQDPLDEFKGKLNEIIQSIRVISVELRPPALAPFGLERAIRSNAEGFRQVHPEISLCLHLMPDGQSLPQRVRLALYRIYQVALTNVVRHAHASRVDVRLMLDAEMVTLEVEDNGCGFQLPERWVELAREGHLGLAGAAERAEAIGGELQVESSPARGTLVRVRVPHLKNM